MAAIVVAYFSLHLLSLTCGRLGVCQCQLFSYNSQYGHVLALLHTIADKR